MYDTETELLVALQAAAKVVGKAVASGKVLAKSLEKFSDENSLGRQDYVADALRAIKSNDLGLFGCGGSESAALCRALEEKLRALRANAHHALMSGLTQRVQKPEHLKILSDSPLVIYLHPLTLEVCFEQCRTTLTYAREPLAVSSLDPAEIMELHAAEVDLFRALRIDSKTFWKLCKTAYDMVLLKDGLAQGARVDIVELITPLSWLWPTQAMFKKNTGMPRFLLAYQIQKLRQDGMIAHNGWRIDLGSATGGSTKNKANVLYIPMGASEGQYYLSICFRQA